MIQTRRVLIVGATSQIALATAEAFASEGAQLTLAARNTERLDEVVSDLSLRFGRPVKALFFSHDRYQELVSQCQLVSFDVILVAYGLLKGTPEELVEVNLTSVITLLTAIVERLSPSKRHVIIVLSSIAGDRAKEKNLIYGSAKAGLNFFLEGMRVRLSGTQIRLVTVKPGPTSSPMLREGGGFLRATPEAVAKVILKATRSTPREAYAPRFWWLLMTLVRYFPRWVFQWLEARREA